MSGSQSVKDMWRDYLKSIGEEPGETAKNYTAWYFCDNQKDADELAALVKAGVKRATASSLWTYELDGEPMPYVGEYSVITNWEGEAVCIIRTMRIDIVPFNEVSEDFARTEGEGDKSLRYWREGHWRFFGRELAPYDKEPAEDMPVICERFEVVYPAANVK